MPPLLFTPNNWYWIVAGSITQVYSSAVGDYVPVTNATYQAWLAAGNTPTKIDTEANLGDALAQRLMRPVAVNVLDGYKQSLANNITAQVIFKILFNHENRIRTLEGQAQITPAQAVAAVKALM